MFTCYEKGSWTPITVYAVDFNHDAFLVAQNGKFKWVSMENFRPGV